MRFLTDWFSSPNIHIAFEGPGKYINSFNIHFWPNPLPGLGPRKDLMASLSGKEHEEVTHINSFGEFLGQKGVGVPNRPFWTTKSFSYFAACLSKSNMTGRRLDRTAEVIPRCPWTSKGPLLSHLLSTDN